MSILSLRPIQYKLRLISLILFYIIIIFYNSGKMLKVYLTNAIISFHAQFLSFFFFNNQNYKTH